MWRVLWWCCGSSVPPLSTGLPVSFTLYDRSGLSIVTPKVFTLYAILNIIWGSTWLALKVSLMYIPPLFGLGLRFTFSAFILWPLLLHRRPKINLSATALKVYFSFGLFSFVGAYSLTYWGAQYIYSSLSAIIWATLPIFVSIAAHFMLPSEPLTLRRLGGGLMGLAGVGLIVTSNGGEGEINLIGVLAILFAVALASGPNVYLKKYHRTVDPLHVNVIAQSISAAVLIPLSFVLEEPASTVWNNTSILALAYLAVFGTVITWTIYFWLYNHLTVNQISTLGLLPPVLASFLGWIFLGETYGAGLFAGGALVLFGVYLIHSLQVPGREGI
ncbi:MAG: DMT family transporter [Candidatus Neomarinimicrobiota bacterium]|nr:DMT family transporter [Candidatus Neomarinimicrobiota bacterium]